MKLVLGCDNYIYRCDGAFYAKASDKAFYDRYLRVFDALREFDHEAVTEIYAQCPDTAGLGLAVANRLKKAAGFHVIEV